MTGGKFQETTLRREHDSAIQSFYLFHVLPIGGPDNASGILGIHRSETEPPFSFEEKRQAEMFLPHLQRALQLRERLARSNIRQQAMLQTMETLALGVLLVTAKGQVQFANPAAEDLLRRRSGLAVNENRLYATAPQVDPEFQRLLRCANASSGRTADTGGMIRLPRQGAKPISLSIYPFGPPASENGEHDASVLIFIGDPELHSPPRRDVLAQSYGLTGAEAKLFEALLAGQRLQDYADQCSISLQTVKTQLSCLFNKTGSARQADLVRDGLSNPILSLTKRDQPQKTPLSKSLYNSIPRSGDARPNSAI
jgi:DNA-binding CsgD family transcriptional regulator/PAS domain-containing protein